MRISDWSSDVCSSDLQALAVAQETDAVDVLPARVRWREVLADVAQRQCAEDRVAQSVDGDVAVAVRDDTAVVRHRRSAERRVGQECVSTFRSRWSQYH